VTRLTIDVDMFVLCYPSVSAQSVNAH